MTTVSSLQARADRLEVTWHDGDRSAYPWIWVRDHAHDVDTLHPITQQRQLWTAGVDIGITAGSARLVSEPQRVEISWTDGSTSELPVEFLARFRSPHSEPAHVESDRVLWDAAAITPHPAIAHDEVMASDDGLAAWLRLVARYGFCVVTDTPPDTGSTKALLERVGYVRETIFGGFWEFTADLTKADTAYTNLELRPHTDGTYSHDAPGLQMLHCLDFDGEGGVSTMVDGFRIAVEMQRRCPEHYAVLARVSIPGQYIGDGSHLMASRPVFRHDHTGELVQVSFNNADRAPFLLADDEMLTVYAALQAFDLIANDPDFQWRHVLRPGDALLFDNWRVLHGRTAYTGYRRLCGGYLNHEDFESRLRLANTASSPT